ncbi:MAG TPA: BON domain-containing protein [Legionella sp.]|nr:BON domain-containing protein [Legionella sp.]
MCKKTLLACALAFSFSPVISGVTYAASNTSAERAIKDTVITAKIKTLYAKSPLVKATKVHVTTINHQVVLSGELDTNTQYERAITLAGSVPGVQEINAENLTVKSSDAPLTDAYTTAKVKGVFLKEKLFGKKAIEYWPVTVETKDSVVFLTGKVETEKQRNNLVQLAKQVNGVKSVNSSITLK